MNYLGLNGILALSGDADGPPTQAGAQIADLGGGALMGAFGILAALRERDRSGEGQLVDVSMFDGALSWLAMVAARVFAAGEQPRRGAEMLSGSLLCYRPYKCADGWVTLGALEPKFFAAFCHGVDREDLIAHQFEQPGSPAHAEVEAIFAGRTRAEWAAFAEQHDCCLEPVLEVEEALESELVRAREMVIEFEQPGAGMVKGLGMPVKLSRTPGQVRSGGPGTGRAHRAGAARVRVLRGGDRGSCWPTVPSRVPPGRARPRVRSWLHERGRPSQDERAGQRSGVSAGTIKHYLREGLLDGEE